MVICNVISLAGRIAKRIPLKSGLEVRLCTKHRIDQHRTDTPAVMGYSDDGFPYVGDVPNRAGQYVLAGFSGHGMPQAFLSAKAVASMIADATKLEESDLPRLYRSTQERFDSKREHASISSYNEVMRKLGLNI